MRRSVAIALPRPTPAAHRVPQLLLAAVGGLLTLVVATGCGAGANQQNQTADTARLPGDPAPVGSFQDQANQAHTDARQTRDSVRAQGGGPAEGLDSLAARGAGASANDRAGQDTNAAMRNQRANP